MSEFFVTGFDGGVIKLNLVDTVPSNGCLSMLTSRIS